MGLGMHDWWTWHSLLSGNRAYCELQPEYLQSMRQSTTGCLNANVLQAILMCSCALGLTINHSTFLCTRINDPLSTSVAGSLKNVLMTFIGIWAFGDFRWQVWNVCGLSISMGGAVWYATRSALKVQPTPCTNNLRRGTALLLPEDRMPSIEILHVSEASQTAVLLVLYSGGLETNLLVPQ